MSPIYKSPYVRSYRAAGLLRDTRGLSSVEYIILLVGIVAGCIALWNRIGEHVHSQLGTATTEVESIEMQGN